MNSVPSKPGLRILMGIPTTNAARMSTAWIDGIHNLQMPLGSALGKHWVQDRPIAEARNVLCRAAIEANVDYLFMVGDDVIPPGNTLLLMLDHIGHDAMDENDQGVHVDMITGIYWTKTYPAEPYIWRGLLKGTYRDWSAGEFMPVDFAGCDCLLISIDVLHRIKAAHPTERDPWFRTDWVWTEEQDRPSSIATEDFWFFTQARKLGLRVFADTSLQCLHEDRATGQPFGLTQEMRQAGADATPEGIEMVADLGAGTDSPHFGDDVRLVRFDARESVRPDVRCDLRALPEVWFGRFDQVHARHVLEHFAREDAHGLVAHWARLLKPGGEMVINVPNLQWAAEQIRADVPGNELAYAWMQLYGGQDYPLNHHHNGFTARKLKAVMEVTGFLEDVKVEFQADAHDETSMINLVGRGRLRADAHRPEALASAWDGIRAAEGQPEAPAASADSWTNGRARDSHGRFTKAPGVAHNGGGT